jgi:hypothetical protein
MMHHRTPGKWIVVAVVMALALMTWILAPDIPPANAQTTQPQATILADALNVRGGPGTAYAVVGQAKAGQTYPITGKSADGKWFVIDLGGKQGWVLGQHVKPTGALDGLVVVKAPAAPKAVAKAASAPRPTPPGFFGYGIQIAPGWDRGAAIGAVNGLGFKWVKVQFPWKEFEGGGPGARNWPDDIVRDLNGNGLNILASIVKAPNWARNPAYGFPEEGPPADPGTYASFVSEFALRYCGRVQAIEVWNEQNLPREWGHEPLDAARYVRLLAAAYRAIKAACPGMIVVSGAPTPTGVNPPDGIRDTIYMEQMYRAGLRNYSDAIGVHPSGYGNPPDVRFQDWQAGTYGQVSHVSDPSFYFRNTMEQYRNIMVKYGDGNKRLWPTEFGWASTGSPVATYEYAAYNSEQAQGEYIKRAFEMMRNWGWVGVAFLWNLNYNKAEPGTEQAAFGIMDRPAYGILQGMPK